MFLARYLGVFITTIKFIHLHKCNVNDVDDILAGIRENVLGRVIQSPIKQTQG